MNRKNKNEEFYEKNQILDKTKEKDNFKKNHLPTIKINFSKYFQYHIKTFYELFK